MAEALPVLVFVRDLMFSSRITGVAQAQNLPVKVIRSPEKLENEVSNRLIVDLNQTGAIEAASAWKTRHGGEVVGFVAHVDSETIEKARQAGIDRILTRGQFVQVIAQVLQG